MDALLFIKTSSLGDVVHQMPAMTDVRNGRPDAHIAWVVEDAFAPLARLHPAVDEVIPVATRRWRKQLAKAETWREAAAFRATLRARQFNTIIDTQGLLRSALIARIARGPHHGYDARSIRETLAARFYDVTHHVAREQHAVTRNRQLTGAALGYTPSGAIDYGLRAVASGLASRTAVLLHGTSRMSKEWPEADWITIGRMLSADGFDIVLPWGVEAERLRSERLSSAIARSRVLPRAALDVTAQVIAGAALVVGVDTGLLHLAAAFRVPLVAIFADSEPGLTGPVGAGAMKVLGAKANAPEARAVIGAIESLRL